MKPETIKTPVISVIKEIDQVSGGSGSSFTEVAVPINKRRKLETMNRNPMNAAHDAKKCG